jgi:hypothetical protein
MGAYVEDASSHVRAGELRWLTWIHAVCKRVGATQPLTIGNYPFQRDVMELTAGLSDFLSFHPYFAWNVPGVDRARYESQLDEAVEFARRAGKELLASETVWGAVDDDQRVKVLRYTLEQLCMREIGFAVHALQHSLVADLHFPAYGPIRNPESMHFVNPDGSLRHGHEAFNDFC